MEFFNDVGNDPSRPSLFELVAQEQLRDLLQPALKYVLAVGILASRFWFHIPDNAHRYSHNAIPVISFA